ncbi:MAG: polysaccharide biosynthesis/export family protein [Nitrospirae bacterium]|nr:polysaccharide biosynthesis/export family protein [Nitrospirota bacterium]
MRDGDLIDIIKSFSLAYKKGFADEYMSFFTKTALENGSDPVDKIRANYAEMISNNIVSAYEFEISDIKKTGDSAVVDAIYNKTLVAKTNGIAVPSSGNAVIRFVYENDKIKISSIDYDKNTEGDYVIGKEDLLDISVWKSPELSLSIIVRPDGMISLPLIGEVRADGRTPTELKEDIQAKLKEFKQEPIVSIIVKESNSKSIFISGEIVKPGKYPLRSDTTITQAISLAGGFTQWANKDKIIIIRKSSLNPEGNRVSIRYSDIVAGTNMRANIMLRPGDTIIVP